VASTNERLLRDTEDEGLAAEAAVAAALLAMMAATNNPTDELVENTISAPITAYALWLVARMRGHGQPLPADIVTTDSLVGAAVSEAATALSDAVKADPELLAGNGAPERAARMAHVAATLITTVTAQLQTVLAPSLGYRSKVWRTRLDNKVRDEHRALEGQRRPLAESWQTPDGFVLRFPGDRRAPPHLWINCRCRLGWSTMEVSVETREAA
jgi:Phage Mu protein F like protein